MLQECEEITDYLTNWKKMLATKTGKNGMSLYQDEVQYWHFTDFPLITILKITPRMEI